MQMLPDPPPLRLLAHFAVKELGKRFVNIELIPKGMEFIGSYVLQKSKAYSLRFLAHFAVKELGKRFINIALVPKGMDFIGSYVLQKSKAYSLRFLSVLCGLKLKCLKWLFTRRKKPRGQKFYLKFALTVSTV